MKSVYIAAAIGTMIATSSSVNAQCVCAPTESACLSECVGRTNSCISECQSNNGCYQSCISMHWPGADPNQQFSEMMPSTTWMSNSYSWSATPTSSSWSSASWSSQYPSSSWNSYATPTIASWSSQWPSNSAWPSGATWSHSGSIMPTNLIPGASGNIMPSSSSSTVTKASNLVIGLALACAAYFLQ